MVQSLAYCAVGWGYHAAGVVCGSYLGLMKGITK